MILQFINHGVLCHSVKLEKNDVVFKIDVPSHLTLSVLKVLFQLLNNSLTPEICDNTWFMLSEVKVLNYDREFLNMFPIGKDLFKDDIID